jgi:hypothetical protein
LSAGIIKFTGLADDNGAASDDQYGANASVSWHFGLAGKACKILKANALEKAGKLVRLACLFV